MLSFLAAFLIARQSVVVYVLDDGGGGTETAQQVNCVSAWCLLAAWLAGQVGLAVFAWRVHRWNTRSHAAPPPPQRSHPSREASPKPCR